MFGRNKDKEAEENAGRLGESYNWISGWYCPECQHFHTKPHFAKAGQLNYKKKPNEVGRVKKDREEKDSTCSESTGPVTDNNGLQMPIFCPH